MNQSETTVVPRAQDRGAMLVAIVIGVGVVAVTVVQAVQRVIEILRNVDVPVAVPFADTVATLPVGPGGSDVEAIATEATIHVSGMPPVTVVSLVLSAVFSALAIIATVVLVSLIIRNIMRGRAFSRSTVALVGSSTFVIAFGWILVWLFTTMGANGAASALAGEPGVNTPIPIDPIVPFAIAALGGLSTAFVVGHRLQTETEGLV